MTCANSVEALWQQQAYVSRWVRYPLSNTLVTATPCSAATAQVCVKLPLKQGWEAHLNSRTSRWKTSNSRRCSASADVACDGPPVASALKMTCRRSPQRVSTASLWMPHPGGHSMAQGSRHHDASRRQKQRKPTWHDLSSGKPPTTGIGPSGECTQGVPPAA